MAKKKAAKKATATKKKAAAKKTTKKKAAKKATKKATKKKTAKKGEDGEEKPVKKKKARRKKKTAADIRMKVFWGVFNHSMKRVALYEFNQRKAAEKRAKELTDSGKPPHFVQKVKEEVQEEAEA